MMSDQSEPMFSGQDTTLALPSITKTVMVHARPAQVHTTQTLNKEKGRPAQVHTTQTLNKKKEHEPKSHPLARTYLQFIPAEKGKQFLPMECHWTYQSLQDKNYLCPGVARQHQTNSMVLVLVFFFCLTSFHFGFSCWMVCLIYIFKERERQRERECSEMGRSGRGCRWGKNMVRMQ